MEELNVLSLGAGIQSSCMVYMCINGDLPKPDVIIFANPQWELKATYTYLEKLMKDVEYAGIPMIVTTKGDIFVDTLRSAQTGERAPSMPFYSEDVKEGTEGIVSRQCTADYKIEMVKKAAREFIGLKPRQRQTKRFVMWQGITTDEIERIKTSTNKMIGYKYPLFELGMDRLDCINYLERNGHGVPPKSSCIGCPFHSKQTWVDIYKTYPEEFKSAVILDEAIRNHPRFNSKLYLHKSRLPLLQAVQNDAMQTDLFDFDGFANDCGGNCGL